jgi:Protein of unknown function (DUF433)
VATIFENLEAGASIEDIMEWFDLTREQVTTVLDFVARSLTAPRASLNAHSFRPPYAGRFSRSSPTTASKKTQDLAWDTFNHGELLRAVEEAAFEVFLTTDKNIRYQQNLAGRGIAIVVSGNSRWPVVKR